MLYSVVALLWTVSTKSSSLFTSTNLYTSVLLSQQIVALHTFVSSFSFSAAAANSGLAFLQCPHPVGEMVYYLLSQLLNNSKYGTEKHRLQNIITFKHIILINSFITQNQLHFYT